MKPRIILSIFIILAAGIVYFLPEKKNNPYQLNAKELLFEMQTGSNMISPDELANYMINKDPSILIIDVRDQKDFEAFHLPGSVSIPLDSIMNESWQGYVDQDVRKNVLYSNGTMKASEAWMLLRRSGYKNNYILKGGLNEWFTTIINPAPPKSHNDKLEIEKYTTRLGYKQFFTGSKVAPSATDSPPALPVSGGNKKKSVEGGCG